MANESLYVDGLGTERTAWTEVGSTPFLNAQDQPTNYVYTTTKKAEHGDFTFTNSGGSGTINSVNLYVYCRNAAGRDLAVFIHDGTSWNEYAVSPGATWGWQNVAIPVLDSWAKIDGALLYIKNANKTDLMDVDAAYLYVDYTASATDGEDVKSASTRIKLPSEDVKSASTRIAYSGEDVKSASTRIAYSSQDVKNASTRIKRLTEDIKNASTNIKRLTEDVKNASTRIAYSSQDVKPASTRIAYSSQDVKSASTRISIPIEGEDVKLASTRIKRLSQDVKSASTRIKRLTEDIKSASTRIAYSSQVTKLASTRIKRGSESIKSASTRIIVQVNSEDIKSASTNIKRLSEDIKSASTRIAYSSQVTKTASTRIKRLTEDIKEASTRIKRIAESIKSASTRIGALTTPGEDVKSASTRLAFTSQVIKSASTRIKRPSESIKSASTHIRLRLLYSRKPKFYTQGARHAVELNATTQYININDSPSVRLAGLDKMSLEFWFKQLTYPSWSISTRPFYRNSVGNGIQVHKPSSRDDLWCYTKTETGVRNMGMGIVATTGVWYHFVVVYDGAYLRPYVNGSPATPYTLTGVFGDTAANLVFNTSKNHHFLVDNVRFYNEALTAGEVLSNMQNYHNPVTSGLVMWLKMNEGSGLIAYDLSGNNNHGDLSRDGQGDYPIWVAQLKYSKKPKMFTTL